MLPVKHGTPTEPSSFSHTCYKHLAALRPEICCSNFRNRTLEREAVQRGA